MPNEIIRCPTCNRLVRISDSMLGRPVACPTCKNSFTATLDSGFVPSEIPSLALPGAGLPLESVSAHAGPVGEVQCVDARPCPFCGERIIATALKCWHCSEMVNPMLREASESAADRAASRASTGGDPQGVISLILGCVAAVCALAMLFTCGFSVLVALPFAAVGAILGFFARGNLKVAGLVLNFAALTLSLIFLVLFVLGVALVHF